MDQRFLEYYNRELRYLRELGGEFAQDFPKIASRLGLDSFECADPYVERLLEGFAFLAARVQLKIDDEFPRFTEHLLDAVCPNYVGPTPSMTVVQFTPDEQQGGLSDGFVIARSTMLRAGVRRDDATACTYRTGHDVTLWPIELAAVTLKPITGASPVDFPSKRRLRAALHIRLRTTNGLPFSRLQLGELTLFFRGSDSVALRLFELCVTGAVGMATRAPSGAWTRLDAATVRPVGLEDSEALLPCGARGFQGYRLLHEYFAFPSRFLFARFDGLASGVAVCESNEIEVMVALDRHEPAIEASVTASGVALFCTPAINLFPKRADRIQLTDQDHEYQVVPDRARPMDFEVHSVFGATAFGSKGELKRTFAPFYKVGPRTSDRADAAFFTVQRRD